MAYFGSTNVPALRSASIGSLGANANSFGTVQGNPPGLGLQTLNNIQTDQPGKQSNINIDYTYNISHMTELERELLSDVQVGSLLFIIKNVDRSHAPLIFKLNNADARLDVDEQVLSHQRPCPMIHATGSVSYTHLTLPTTPYV